MFPGIFGPLGFLQQHWAEAAAGGSGIDPAFLPHWEYMLRSEGIAPSFKLPPHLGGLIKPGPMDTPLSSTILGINPGIRQHLLSVAASNDAAAATGSPTSQQLSATAATSSKKKEEESGSKLSPLSSSLGSAFKQVKPVSKMPSEKKEKGVWRPY